MSRNVSFLPDFYRATKKQERDIIYKEEKIYKLLDLESRIVRSKNKREGWQEKVKSIRKEIKELTTECNAFWRNPKI